MGRPVGSIFEAGSAVLFDLDDTLIDRDQSSKIEAIGAARYFDAVLISEEVGIAKPDPVIFRQAMSRLNAAPGRSVFIGDSLEHDITGARNAGMMTVYLNRSGTAGVDESLCDLVVSDLRELADRVVGLGA